MGRRHTSAISTLELLVLATLLPTAASAQIVGVLEAPSGFASGISNVQGWAYTQTEGAELVQPFQVRINGEDSFLVPCCGDRADVQGVNPDAPLQTGFSGVFNWGNLVGENSALVEVIITDDMGGMLTLSTTVEVHQISPFAFNSVVEWAEPEAAVAESSQGIVLGPPPRCLTTNTATFTPGAAELICTNMMATSGNGQFESTCTGQVRFSWDRASQGFKQTSPCETEKLVFLGSTMVSGDIGGVAEADQACQDEADADGRTGRFRAWFSEGSSSPNTRFRQSLVPYVLPNGTQVAANYNDLLDGVLLAPINRRLDSSNAGQQQVLTGTTNQGLSGPGLEQCNGWTSTNDELPMHIGDSSATNTDWTDRDVVPCDEAGFLYCFEQ